MGIKPRINSIVQVTPYFGHLPGGTPTPAGSLALTGTADPDVTVVLSDQLQGGAALSSNMSRGDGTWFLDVAFFSAVPLDPGWHDLVVTSYPSGRSGVPGPASDAVSVNVGTDAADSLSGPLLGTAEVTGAGYVFSGPGNDVITAYSVLPEGAQPQRGVVIVDGGRERIGGGLDTVLMPIPLDGLEAHHWQGSTNGSPSLVLQTAEAIVTLLQVERIGFADLTLTVQSDPLVDFLFYDGTYRDVALADADVRAHYDAHGWREGRDPNALFSTRGYLNAYGDVRDAEANPLDHYAINGWREGRNPSAAFDTALYARFNPDVVAAGIDPLRHYLMNGDAEGRRAFPAIGSGTVQNGFDPLYYKLANPDVTASGLDARAHFETFGSDEGRNPNAFFDTNFYRGHNLDVVAAGVDPLAHFNAFGWREGRDPSSHFNTSAYLAAYADVEAAGINPLQHFLQFGAAEARSGFGDLF
ncbi:hypothetical protein [Roseomonas sp. WA12]